MGKKKKSGGIKEAVLMVALAAAVETIVERVISYILDYFFK